MLFNSEHSIKRNFRTFSLLCVLDNKNLVSKYLLLGPDMIPEKKIKSAERLVFRLDEVLNYANESEVSNTQMSMV